MRPIAFLATMLSAAITAIGALLIMRAVDYSGASLAFIVAAIVGTNIGLVVQHRAPGATLTPKIKALLGATLACSAALVGIAMQVSFRLFDFPEVTLPLAMLGSFVFPWAIANTMWKALDQQKRP